MNNIIYVGKHLLTLSVGRHAHNSWELVYCTEGSGAFHFDDFDLNYKKGDIVVIKGAKDSVLHGKDLDAYLVRDGKAQKIDIRMDELTDVEKQIIVDGCLINYYKKN